MTNQIRNADRRKKTSGTPGPMSTSASTKGSLSPDEPIQSREQDLLSRGPLVDAIVRQVVQYKDQDCIVVSLNSPWGAGKSSFLNLLAEHLTTMVYESDTPRPTVIRFNPWHFENVDELLNVYFDQLSRAIGNETEIQREIGKLLGVVGSIVTTAEPIGPVVSKLLGSALRSVGNTLNKAKDLNAVRSKIDELLCQQRTRIIILIDDIDRLEPNATKVLFRMIRLTANFPYLMYILSFDRMVVESKLDDRYGMRGRDYLEKIVQVSFDIPCSEPDTILRIFQSEVKKVVQSAATRDFDYDRWRGLLRSGLRDHFRTLRQVKRFTNSVRLSLSPIAEEVNPVDFLVIEVFRVFHAEIYARLSQSKELLLYNPSRRDLLVAAGARAEVQTEDLTKAAEELYKLAPDHLRESVKQLLTELFPSFPDSRNRNDVRWRNERRVCSPDTFDRYFLLAVPRGALAETYVDTFMTALGDDRVPSKILEDALRLGKARSLLERVQDRIHEVTNRSIQSLVRLMADHSDELVFPRRNTSDVSADLMPMFIIVEGLRKVETEDDRIDACLDVITNGHSLHTVIRLVNWIGSLQNGDEQDLRIFAESGPLDRLRSAASDRIMSAIRDDTIPENNKFIDILVYWYSWDKENVLRAVTNLIDEDKGLLEFIGRIMKDERDGNVVLIQEGNTHVSPLNKLVDVKNVTDRLGRLLDGRCDDSQHVAQLLEFVKSRSIGRT